MTSALPPSLNLQRDRLLAPMTSWRIGGPARYFAEPTSSDELRACLEFALDRRLPVFALGGGTNLLVSDEGYPGLVLRYSDSVHAIETDSTGRDQDVALVVGARASLARTARRSAADGWAGLEWAEGIPGTVGGAVVGNAGAYGGETAQVVESVQAFSLEGGLVEHAAEQCGFAYRRSVFQPPAAPVLVTSTFIARVRFRLQRADPAGLLARVREISEQRRARTPAGLSCGSVFRNPPGDSAGRLIEHVGLKGTEHGGAQISPQHANYIVNRGGATAEDVRALIEEARGRVLRECGIELQLEVRLLG